MVEDECPLVWGDLGGMGWGKRNTPLAVPLTNERQRQPYYGAIKLLTREGPRKEGKTGNGENTPAYIQGGQSL